MKKIFAVLAVLAAFCCAFAEEDISFDESNKKVDTSMQVIVPENQHVTNKTGKIRLEYTPSMDEVRIYYTCMEATFSESDAREAIHACLLDFQLEHQYFGYKYLRRDRTSFMKDARNVPMAQYVSHVKFNR